MILTASGDTTARAQVVAKFLKEVGRTEIPIGVGVPTSLPVGPLFAWAQDTPLSSYPGTVYFDGVAGAIDIIQGLAAQGQTSTSLPLHHAPTSRHYCSGIPTWSTTPRSRSVRPTCTSTSTHIICRP